MGEAVGLSPASGRSAGDDGTVSARVLRGAGALSVGTLVHIVGQLLIVPVGMCGWGATRYGEWVALSAVVAFLSISDLGIQTATVNKLCEAYARGSRTETLLVLHSALKVQLPVVSALWGVCAVCVWVLPLEMWLGVESSGPGELQLALVALAGEVLLGVPMGVIAGTYRATLLLPRAALIGAAQHTVLTVVMLALILDQASFAAVAMGRLLVAALFSVWIWQDLRRIHPWLRLWPIRGDLREGLTLLASGTLFLLLGAADLLSVQLPLLVLQAWWGGAALAGFATQRTLVSLGRTVGSLLTRATWPELTMMGTQGEDGRLARAHRVLAKGSIWSVGVALACLIPVSAVLYPWWTARALDLDWCVMCLLGAQGVAWALWASSWTVLASTSRQGRLAAVMLVNSLLVGALSLALAPVLGLRGTASAVLLGDLLVAVWAVPALACRAVDERPRRFFRQVAPVASIGALMPLVAGTISWRLEEAGMLWPIVTTLVACLLGSAAIWKQLSSSERAALIRGLPWKSVERSTA